MNNFIEYFYNIKVDKIDYNNKYYSFYYDNYLYRLYILDELVNIHNLLDLDKKLIMKTLINEIILNKFGKMVTKYNNIIYILMRIFVNPNKNISLEEINYLNNILVIQNINSNWGKLWSKKIDYLEKLINENGKKYPIIVDSFNYFVGMTENAIAYFNNINIPSNYLYYISHKQIRYTDKVDILYNPINIIFDYKVRDMAEYIKNSFFLNNKNIFNEINHYILNNNLSLIDIKILISRLLYPSFYFELYEDILVYNKDETIIIDIINKIDEYEKYLALVISYLNKKYDVEDILWLKKRLDINQPY